MKDIIQNNSGNQQPTPAAFHHDAWFFIKNQNMVVYLVVAALALVALGYAFYTIKTSRANEQASRLLGVAQTPKQFEELLRQYSQSPSAPVALLALAATQYSAGAYDAALGLYNEFTARYPQHSMLVAAELGKVMCAEARGEMDNALLGFNSFLLRYPDSFLMPQALFGKARCLQATGKLAEARVVYEDFIAAHPKNKWRQQAEAALQALDRQKRLQPGAGQTNKFNG